MWGDRREAATVEVPIGFSPHASWGSATMRATTVWFLGVFLHFSSLMDPLGMTQSQLRAKIRELIASGVLPQACLR